MHDVGDAEAGPEPNLLRQDPARDADRSQRPTSCKPDFPAPTSDDPMPGPWHQRRRNSSQSFNREPPSDDSAEHERRGHDDAWEVARESAQPLAEQREPILELDLLSPAFRRFILRPMAQEHTGQILVVESDPVVQSELERQLSSIGHIVETASDGVAALDLLERSMPDVVLVELELEGMDGFDFLRRARALLPSASFIAMAKSGSMDTAVKALRCGADRCLTRPIRRDALELVVERSLDKPLHAREAMDARAEAAATLPTTGLNNIVGAHPAMQRLFNRMLQTAQSRSTVLIQGETGTGKELIAKAIHEHSRRNEGPLVRLNCAALAETVLESELFGHEKGAFTGAVTRRVGRFEQADGGTLFLDELSEMPLSVQVKLLRFLQEREFERVGGNETVTVNVRVVAATNRDLRIMVDDGKFRGDLYFRLKVVVLEVPPLRARPGDIPLLADHFLRLYAEENAKRVHGFTPRAKEALLCYPWPGNVRELQHAIEQAVVLCENDLVSAEDLPIGPADREAEPLSLLVPGVTLAEVERYTIMKTLAAVGGSPTKAAAILGISKRTIQYRLQEWGVTKRDPSTYDD
jgi:DNA-binding NtrC family response regulator